MERPWTEYKEESLSQRVKSQSQSQINLTKVHTINSTREMGKKATVSAQERRVINYKGRGQII